MKLRTETIPGAELCIGESCYLYFGGTAYLGMQTHPQFREAHAQFTLEMGTHWGASRAGNLVLSVYDKTEKTLAAWLGSEACLTLSSGFMAARLLAEHFASLGYPCYFSPNSHEALLPPGSKRTSDWETLRGQLEQSISKGNKLPPVVFTDSLGEHTNPGPIWESLESLPKQCILVADDSHGLGICGDDGSGSWKALSAYGFSEFLLCGSLGKAMGVTAGIIAGSIRILDQLRETPFFAGASPAPPAGLAALQLSLNNGLYLRQYRRLMDNVNYFDTLTRHLGSLISYPGYPVFCFTNTELASHLFRNQILITDFEYVAEAGSGSPKRIVITASHEKTHLDQLAEVLKIF